MAGAGIDWQRDPEAAFAEARARGLPLLLYWGAAWCPPCNRIKSLVFGRPDFLALSDSFVALAIDGDSAGAQRLGEERKLRSYPTLVVYRPDGAEVTRLPCELDGKRFVHILALALNARYTAAESLSVALSRERALSDDDWNLLSFYSWDTDERQLLKNLDFAAIVASLTRACTLPHAALRLEWLGLHAAAMAGETGVDQAAAIARLETTLNDPAVVCQQLDIVIGYALDLVRFLTEPGSGARLALIDTWSRALEVLEYDDTLNLCDRLGALRTRVRLARLGAGNANLAALARDRVAAAVAAADAPALRHAVINGGAGILMDAGLALEAAQLLQNELARSHSPFFFMHTLAAIAKRRGDPAGALDWYERAWQGATGSATRIQWGASWLLALLDLAPGDEARIERCAQELSDQFEATPDAGCQRNRTQAARIAKALSGRDELGEQLQRLRGLVLRT
ncbi:thioredoxin family protein [Massilia sp. R2A-15]|uniref:thioredoxin family protein n=1 Tax=Massilia sp. R2A-15 TaxID=3064278 RepID=UPI0027376391|nr:thioredoxin family protein [Massilia sp. R2A-15]WLI88832.1 thioredoxin family protein [Massilia sp. R2A-15]